MVPFVGWRAGWSAVAEVGITAAGFAWLEDVVCIGSGDTLGDSLLTAAMRLIMARFAHDLS